MINEEIAPMQAGKSIFDFDWLSDLFEGLWDFMDDMSGWMWNDAPYWESNPSNSIFTGPKYKLTGTWDPMALAVEEASAEFLEFQQTLDLTFDMVEQFRAGNSAYMATLVGPTYDFWAQQVTVETVNREPCTRRETCEPWYYITTPNDADNCGLIYYHGGSGLMLTAAESQWNVNRYAVITRCTIFNVDYRLAPEYNVEAGNSGIDDAVNAANTIADRVASGEHGSVDPSRLAYFGESGGGWITGGMGYRFAQNGGGDRFRFQLIQLPQVGNLYAFGNLFEENETPEDYYNDIERGYQKYFTQVACNQFNGDPFCYPQDIIYNPMIFSNEMGLELASQVPPTIIYTTEFDFFRKMGEEACYLYEEAGTLLDCGIQAGTTHMTFTDWNNPASQIWYEDLVRIVDAYLQ